MGIELTLDGRTAIVTGGGRGIGRAIATVFAEAGADVVVAARTESEIEETAELVRGHGVEALAARTDLTETDDIDNLVSETIDRFGTPDVLVNNAGANLSGEMLDRTPDEVETMLSVNLQAVFLLSQRFARAFRESPPESSGRIINISSIFAQVGIPSRAVYGGSKAGIYGLTKALAAELAQDRITVNSVSPGRMQVDRIADREADEEDSGGFVVDRVPLERVGDPAETAHLCLYLASDYAEYITGEDVKIDGGVTFTTAAYPEGL